MTPTLKNRHNLGLIADHPLEIVVIEQAQLDIAIIDGTTKLPLGHPSLTCAVDAYSRMITGFHLSIDTPINVSFEKCLGNAIFPKDELLKFHEIDADWNACGLMKTLFADHAYNLISEDVRNVCVRHGIQFLKPDPRLHHSVGIVEHIFSLINNQLGNFADHSLTLSDLEKWLITFICRDYQNQTQPSLGMSPKEKWEIAINENSESHLQTLPENSVELRKILMR